MHWIHRHSFVSLVAGACWLLVSVSATAQVPPPLLSELAFLPGDDMVDTAVEVQDWPQIAAGGPGYLVVWEDMRTVLCGFTSMPGNPLCGNGWDIYAARLDAAGNLLDESPILISQEGRNQTRPQVAWNGENWLVVWTSERPDWYFFEDIVGKRISPAGLILDPAPIPIRLDSNTTNPGHAPQVGSDGLNWLVVWEDQEDIGGIMHPSLAGRRIGPDGNPVDPLPVTLQVHSVPAFGPRQPQVVWAGDEYLVLWTEAAPAEVRGKRFTASLTPLDAQPIHVANEEGGRVATNGADFLVVTDSRRGYRVNHAGVVLDPAGIDFDTGVGFQPSGPEATWDGFDWVVAFSSNPDPPTGTEADVYMARISAGGALLEGPIPVLTGTTTDYQPVLASAATGSVQLVWAPRSLPSGFRENIRSARVLDISLPPSEVDVGVGLPRQARTALATNGSEHLAAFSSQGGGLNRLLVQRLAADGTPIDLEPVELASYSETTLLVPDVAFDGLRYLVVWALDGSVWGQRVAADAQPIDPAPFLLLTDAASAPAVGGLAGRFLLAYAHLFSGDQQTLKVARIEGSDLTLLDTPFEIGFNYVLAPDVAPFGGQWLVAWERQPTHDVSASAIHAALVTQDGVATPDFLVDEGGYGDDPWIAPAADRALIVWHDNFNFNEASIEGRLLALDGSFLTSEILIADEANDQFFPAAAWDGDQFAVAWMDFRALSGIEQLRADIWAARVDADGNVLDPAGGFQVTEGPFPEDLPALAGADGNSVMTFTKLHGVEGPEVQRIGYRVLGVGPSLIFGDGFESGDLSAWSASVP